MARIASEALVERLIDWGVDTVFGLHGDGIKVVINNNALGQILWEQMALGHPEHGAPRSRRRC